MNIPGDPFEKHLNQLDLDKMDGRNVKLAIINNYASKKINDMVKEEKTRKKTSSKFNDSIEYIAPKI